MEFSKQEYWSGLPFPSPGIFPTQGSNLGLLHCRRTLYRLSHQGTKGVRDELENALCFLRETYHCILGEECSILQRTCTEWPLCCLGGSPLHSWWSRKSCRWISPKGCKPDVHAQDVSVLDRSQLKKENKSVLLLSHPVACGKNPGNQNYYLSNVRHQASQEALVVKNLPANAGDKRDLGSIPGLGSSPGGRHSNPFQYSCLENPMDRGTWQATVHGVTESRTWLKGFGKEQAPWKCVCICSHHPNHKPMKLVLYCPCFTMRNLGLESFPPCCQGAITTKWWIWDSNAGESDFTASALNLLLTQYAPGKAKHADLTPKPAGT